MKAFSLVFLFIALGISNIWGQRTDFFGSDVSAETRTLYHQSITFNEQYSSSFDAGLYCGVGSNTWTRWGIRGHIKRKISQYVAVDLGFMYNHISALTHVAQEYRPHQALHFNHPMWGNFPLKHRLRLEERIFTNDITEGSTFQTRLRYQISTKGSFNGQPINSKSLYYKFGAEWSFNIYDEIPNRILIRGRFTSGIGYQFNTHYGLDFNYQFQHDAQEEIRRHTYTHIYLLTFRHYIDLREKN